jgi:RNA polymerase sigma factor (TIGR02999 family)
MDSHHDAHPDGSESLFGESYDQLRAVARKLLLREREGHTLQATALVHEAYLKLQDQVRAKYAGKTHFIAVNATIMRRILVDHARSRATQKRGGDHKRVTLDETLGHQPDRHIDLIDFNDALDELSDLNQRRGAVVDLRLFGGLTVAETADYLGVGERTVKEDFRVANAWLGKKLQCLD